MPAPHLQALVERGVIALGPGDTIYLTQQAWRNATAGTMYDERPMLHFVGFKDDRWHNAVRVFGKPDFIHRFWDRRARDEVMPADKVVFATGDEMQQVKVHAYDDSAYF